MIARRLIESALAWSALTLWLSTAQADSVRYLSDASEPFNRRVVAEIESVGLEVEQPIAETAALPDDCVALIRVSNASGDVEVWLRNGSSLALATKLSRDMTATDDDSGVRIAEAVRGILAPLAEKRRAEAHGPLPPAPEPIPAPGPEPAAPGPEPAAAPGPEQAAAPRDTSSNAAASTRNWEAAAALAALSQPGGVGVGVLLGLRRRMAFELWADVSAVLPVVATSLEARGASAEVQARLVGGTLAWDFQNLVGFPLRAGAGATLAWVEARGDAAAPRRGVKDAAVAVLPHVKLQSGVDITRSLAAEVAALAAYSANRTDIAFGSEVVGTFGRPLLVGYVGISIRP
jgi:hypothetical protein